MYLLSQALGFVVARQLAGTEPWLSQQKSTMAFLAGAVLAPASPALLGNVLLPLVGFRVGPGLPAAIDTWLRGSAGILALGPAVLVYGSGPLKKWLAHNPPAESHPPIAMPDVLETLSKRQSGPSRC
ncbi:MAG: hypothetical protein JO108_28360 [Acidobacteriaceae bacterium]|nr:hypothetical protein [Acidobacteriaceae bacterium]